jgi:hypothetical protein
VSEFLSPFLYLSAFLLCFSGLDKVRFPDSLTRSLRSAGLDSWDRAHSRLVGATELALGIWALLGTGEWRSVGVSFAFLVFSIYIAYLLIARPESASCGCLTSKDVPPSWLHVGMNAAIVAAVGLGILFVAPPFPVLLAHSSPFTGCVLVFGLITGTILFNLVISQGAEALHAYSGDAPLTLGHDHSQARPELIPVDQVQLAREGG